MFINQANAISIANFIYIYLLIFQIIQSTVATQSFMQTYFTDNLYSTAVNDQIVHFYDRSLKICRITNIAEIIISRYGSKSNSILVDRCHGI